MKNQNNKKISNKEIQSEISRLQNELSKRGQRKPKMAKGPRGPTLSQAGPRRPAPVSSSQKQTTGTAKIIPSAQGCVVKHREFIENVSPTSAGWQVLKRYRINPGSVKTFPWLSTMALSWEQYRFRKLKFHFIPRAPSTTPGSLQVSPDYDAQDGQPATEQQLTQNRDTVENNPWETLICTLKPEAMNRAFKSHFVMSDSRFSATTQDEKTIDAGQVFVAADADGALNWGKLWVDYEVELTIPQTPIVSDATDGALVGLSSGIPFSSGGLFSNTKPSLNIVQNVGTPILEAIDNSIVNSPNIAKFLRDWQGRVNMTLAGSAQQTASVPTYPSICLNGEVQGSSSADQRASFVSGAANNYFVNLAGNYTNYERTVDVIAKAGDILGINTGGLPASFTGSSQVQILNLLLGAASQFS